MLDILFKKFPVPATKRKRTIFENSVYHNARAEEHNIT